MSLAVRGGAQVFEGCPARGRQTVTSMCFRRSSGIAGGSWQLFFGCRRLVGLDGGNIGLATDYGCRISGALVVDAVPSMPSGDGVPGAVVDGLAVGDRRA